MANAAQRVSPDFITSKPDWWPDWTGKVCAIIASGPSAKSAPITALRDKVKIIVINEGHNLCPWADVLYGCDAGWWQMRAGVRTFRNLKISQDERACRMFPEIRKVDVDPKSNELKIGTIGQLGAGGNSGFQALNLAVQFGVYKIILIGYDMRVDLGEHWHPRHYPPLSNPHPQDNIPRWRTAIDGAADTLKILGIDVLNCSAVSLLKAYPKMTIQEALRWDGH